MPVVTDEVSYDHAAHRYSLQGITYTSATQLIARFKKPFDTKERSEWMAFRYGNTPEYWLNKWREKNQSSLVRGDRIHSEQENSLYQARFVNMNPSPLPVLVPTGEKPYLLLPDGVYPELKLWRHDYFIAGRADKVILKTWYPKDSTLYRTMIPGVETVDYIRIADVEDYKTNEKIRMHGFQNPDGTTEKLLPPLQHVEASEYWEYALQLSIYQFMLEYQGFLPGNRRLIHFPHEIEGLGTPQPVHYDLPYLREEVIAMIKHTTLCQ